MKKHKKKQISRSTMSKKVKLASNTNDLEMPILIPEVYLGKLEELLRTKQLVASENLAREFIQYWPQDGRSYMALGMALRMQDRNPEGIAAYKKAIELDGSLLVARNNLGRALVQTGKFKESVDVLRELVRLDPSSADANSLLSWSLHHLDAYDEAILFAQAAIALEPNHTNAWQNLGNGLRSVGKNQQAADAYRRVIAINPKDLDARTCLGSVLKDWAQYPEAREVMEEGCRFAPSDNTIWTNYFFALNYDPYLSAEDIALRYREWGRLAESTITPRTDWGAVDKNPERQIRVGLVSGDFCRHVIRFFIYPLLDRVDRDNFHWTLYSNTIKEDAETEVFKQKADCWRDIRWQPNKDIVDLIRRDKIDILIDLASHTAGNCLLVFAAKAAPVQISTMMGTAYTTGLTTIDYFIADIYCAPAEASHLYTEKLIRFPHNTSAFYPEIPSLSVAESPAKRNGFVTFGCLSRSVRLNTKVIAAWIRIMQSLPTARLRLDHPQVVEQETKALLQKQFLLGGIRLERIDLLNTRPHWSAYDEIDIALDPFPHNAGSTTVEALWKGLPVLTLSERPPLGRLGDSIISSVGLTDWIASNVEDYINKAVIHASDIEKLALLRLRLRQRFQLSSLMDYQGNALYYQAALTQAWYRFCSDKNLSDIDVLLIERDIDWVNARLAVGTRYLQEKELNEAEFYFREVLKCNPREARAWLNLGMSLYLQGNHHEALRCFQQSVEHDAHYVSGWFNLGVTLQAFRRYDEAEQAYLKLLALDETHHESWNALGVIYRDSARGDEALTCLKMAMKLCPNNAVYLANMGSLLEKGDRLLVAKHLLERSLTLNPQSLLANSTLGIVYQKLAMIDEAITQLRKNKESTAINHTLLFAANYHPDLSAQQLYALYESECEKLNQLPWRHTKKPKPKKVLRIGFIGGDFRAHTVSKFLLPLFQAINPEKITLMIFANQIGLDSVSEQFKHYAKWLNVYAMLDEQLIDCIQEEDIDILIDVAGWTEGNRLEAMAYKPAPIQITWLGYAYTTGLKAIDWFLGSPRYTPPGCEAYFSEKIFNMPNIALCIDKIESFLGAPEVNPLPALTRSEITFGSLTRTIRLNHRVIQLWSQLLKEIPLSKLILDNKPFEDPEVCDYFYALFEQQGITKERITLRYSTPHWFSYHDIDIALDTFPHNVGTTTIDALFMGVPSISLRERPPLGRIGDAILSAIGLEEWVVDTEQAYIDCARQMLGDLTKLAELRYHLRERLLNSVSGNLASNARDFEKAMFTIWDQAITAE